MQTQANPRFKPFVSACPTKAGAERLAGPVNRVASLEEVDGNTMHLALDCPHCGERREVKAIKAVVQNTYFTARVACDDHALHVRVRDDLWA